MTLTVILGMLFLFISKRKSYFFKVVTIILTFSIARVLFGTAWRTITPNINTTEPSCAFYVLLTANFFILSVLLIHTANYFTNESYKSLGWTGNNTTKNSLIGLATGGLIFLILTLNKGIEFHKFGPALFLGFLIASWQEENIFRGYLMKYLSRKFDMEETIIYQAMIYSLCHIGFYSFFPTLNLIVSLGVAFIMGIIFGCLKLKTESQIPGFLAHGIIDVAFLIT